MVKEKCKRESKSERGKKIAEAKQRAQGNGRWQWFVTAGVLHQKNKEIHFSFLCLYLERSLCSPHADTHTLLTASLSSKQTLRQPLSVKEPTISPLWSEQRQREKNSPQRDEEVHREKRERREATFYWKDLGSSPLVGRQPHSSVFQQVGESQYKLQWCRSVLTFDLSPLTRRGEAKGQFLWSHHL